MEVCQKTWAHLGLLQVVFSGFESLLDYQFVKHTNTPLESFPEKFGCKTLGRKIGLLKDLAKTHPGLALTATKAEILFSDSNRNTFAHGRYFTSKTAGGVKAVNVKTYPVSKDDVVDLTRDEFADFVKEFSLAVHAFQVEIGVQEDDLIEFTTKLTSP